MELCRDFQLAQDGGVIEVHLFAYQIFVLEHKYANGIYFHRFAGCRESGPWTVLRSSEDCLDNNRFFRVVNGLNLQDENREMLTKAR